MRRDLTTMFAALLRLVKSSLQAKFKLDCQASLSRGEDHVSASGSFTNGHCRHFNLFVDGNNRAIVVTG